MDVLEAIKMRRSVRAYSSRPIPQEVLGRMRQALRWAPSACNYQPWRFILVSDAELRRELSLAAHDQLWMAEAPVTVVGCGLPADAYKYMGGDGNSADLDVTIALDHLTLAAVADGLGTCWIGSFNEQQVKRLLEIPPQAKVVAMTPLGYPSSPDLIHPLAETDRKPESDIFSSEHFGSTAGEA